MLNENYKMQNKVRIIATKNIGNKQTPVMKMVTY